MMGWILGFGIPIAYFVIGAFNARRIYRFKVRHDTWFETLPYSGRQYVSSDAPVVVAFAGVFWPLQAPFYFLAIQTRVTKSFGGGVYGWFTKNTPLSVKAEEKARVEKAAQQAARIKELEIECGIREKPAYERYHPGLHDYIA